MLRASAKASDVTVDLRAVADPSIDSGIRHGAELLAFADAVTGSDAATVTRARAGLRRALGSAALVQTAAIVANFNLNDRAANATGIVLENVFLHDSADYRKALGIDRYPSARNTLKPQ